MPVDFNRIPPRVAVPAPPQPSIVVWTVLLVIVVSVGAGLTITLWPTGRPTNTLWFWFCLIGYPLMAWVFLLCSRLAYGHTCRNGALATNSVCDEAEQACHAVASQPLAILGHAWCFSSGAQENTLEGILQGALRMQLQPSRSIVKGEVKARWLDVPDRHFDPGNELDEQMRHQVLCTWLLEHLMDRLAPQLKGLPPQATLQVVVHGQTTLTIDAIETPLQQWLAEHVRVAKVDVSSTEHAVPLFRTDAWLDHRDENVAYLLVSITLRDAISQALSSGVAEAGVALLLGPPRFASMSAPALHLHRPAKERLAVAASTLALAVRWGLSSVQHLRTVWAHGLSSEQGSAMRKALKFESETRWMPLETAVGDCSGTGPWLALALAAENAQTSGDPQLVLCEEDDALVALVCRKPI